MLHYNPLEVSSVTYPWCFNKNYFTALECKKIIKYCGSLTKQKATVFNEDSQTITKRFSDIAWVEYNEDSKWFYDKLALGIDSLNQKFYQFDLTGFQNLQFTEYNSLDKAKYDWHMDIVLGHNTNSLTRKLSATLLLNDEFEGGDFEFFDFEKRNQPCMPIGSLIIFPSFMTHRVMEVTKGVRNSLVCWCVGPKFK